MKKKKRIMAVLMLMVLLLSFSIRTYALNITVNEYNLNGSVTLSSSSISGTFTVTHTLHYVTPSLSCSVQGTAYNGVGAAVGSFSASNTVYYQYKVTASGAGICYVGPAYDIHSYTFKGVNYTD